MTLAFSCEVGHGVEGLQSVKTQDVHSSNIQSANCHCHACCIMLWAMIYWAHVYSRYASPIALRFFIAERIGKYCSV